MQPTFNPWIGYFDLINSVDTFIFLDTVQLNQQSWQTRNKIKASNQEYLVSIPIDKNSSKSQLFIKNAQISASFKFVKIKLLKSIAQEYKKSEYFEETYSFIEELIRYDTSSLSEFNINIIKKISKKIGIKTPFLRTSELQDFKEKKSLLVLEVCKHVKSDVYLSPHNAKDYLEENLKEFEKNSIKILIQNYKHPIYKQQGKEFISYLGIFDLLLNNGFEKSLSIITQGSTYENI